MQINLACSILIIPISLNFNYLFTLQVGNNRITFLKRERELVTYWKCRTLWTLNAFKFKIESKNNRCLMKCISKLSFKLLILLSYVCLVLWKKRDFCPTKILNFGKQNCIHLHNHPSRSLAITFIWDTLCLCNTNIHFLDSKPSWLQMPEFVYDGSILGTGISLSIWLSFWVIVCYFLNSWNFFLF